MFSRHEIEYIYMYKIQTIYVNILILDSVKHENQTDTYDSELTVAGFVVFVAFCCGLAGWV